MSLSGTEILGIFQLLITLVVGLVGWMLNSTLRGLQHRLTKNEADIESAEMRITGNSMNIEKVLERQGNANLLLNEKLGRITDKMDRQSEMIADLANALKERKSV